MLNGSPAVRGKCRKATKGDRALLLPVLKKFRLHYPRTHRKSVIDLIVYNKLWETMKQKEITQYALIKKYKISTGQLDRLRKNENVSTHTLDALCKILNCKLEDIAEFVSDNEKCN